MPEQIIPAQSPKAALLPDLSQRSYQPELMDAEGVDREILWQTLRELETVNRWLGGYATTLKGLQELLAGGVRAREWSIVDVGCGGGDTLRVVADWARQRGYRFRLSGVDMQPDCLEYAKKHAPDREIEWICADFREVAGPYDIVITSQFCHHLDDALMREFFGWTRRSARLGFVINDLHRHPVAYHGFHALSALFSRSPFIRYDGPMSVRKAFSRSELADLAGSAGLHPRILWQWAFRYLVLGYV
ncbi:MAG: methyltransferase domain-containing protein [Candidatus Sericytochromatia bacterium]